MTEDSDLCYYQIHQCVERESGSFYESDVPPLCESYSPEKPQHPKLSTPKNQIETLDLEGFEFTEALPVPKELESLEMPFVEMQYN